MNTMTVLQAALRCRRWLGALVLALATAGALAGVRDVVISDLSSRSLSLVWAVDEPVIGASLSTFADAAGSTPLSGVQVDLLSDPGALQQGLVKLRVSGLPADSSVWLRTQTSTASGLQQYPNDSSLIEALTAQTSALAAGDGSPLPGDLLQHGLRNPAGGTASGGLMLLNIAGLSDYPLSGFADAGGVARVDLANLQDDVLGSRAQLVGGERVALIEYRGRSCVDPLSGSPQIDQQRLLRYRRLPSPLPGQLQVVAPAACFSPSNIAADFDCDGRIGPQDFNQFLSGYGLVNDGVFPDCRFNPDLDLQADQRIGPQDFNQFLAVFGMQE